MYHLQQWKHWHISSPYAKFFYHAEIWVPLSYARELSRFLTQRIWFCSWYEFGFSWANLLPPQIPSQCKEWLRPHHKMLPCIRWCTHHRMMLEFWFSWVHFIFIFLSCCRFWPSVTTMNTFLRAYYLPSAFLLTLNTCPKAPSPSLPKTSKSLRHDPFSMLISLNNL